MYQLHPAGYYATTRFLEVKKPPAVETGGIAEGYITKLLWAF